MAAVWIAHVQVNDPDRYAEYMNGATQVIPAFDGEFIVRGGRHEQREGRDYPRNVVVRFPTYERAVECYESEEYQEILAIALEASERTFVIVETVD